MTISGIDLSHYQASVPDLTGLAFVIHKCTQGTGLTDSFYAGRQTQIRNAGLVWGAYHFFSSLDDPAAQAGYFLSNANLQLGDFAAVDFEDDGNWYQFSQAQLAAKVTTLINALSQALGPKRLVIYCNRDTYNNIIIPLGVPLRDGLWIASPGVTPQMTWVFWQYASSPVDEDYGNFASLQDIKNWALNGQSTTPPPPPPGRSTQILEDAVPMGAWPAAIPNEFHHLTWPCGPDNSAITAQAWLSLSVGGANSSAKGHVWFIAANGQTPNYLHDEEWTLGSDTRKWWACPPNTDVISVLIEQSTNELAWCLEIQAK